MRPFFLALLLGFAVQSIAIPAPSPPEPAIVGKYVVLHKSMTNQKGGGGVWGTSKTAGSRQAVTITRNQISISGITTVWSYSLGTGTPQSVDLTFTPLRGKPTVHKAIMEVNGDRITMAYATEGEDERPKNFEDAPGVTVYVFQKAPPPPQWEYRIVELVPGRAAEVERELNKLAAEGFEVTFATNGSANQPTAHYLLKRLKP